MSERPYGVEWPSGYIEWQRTHDDDQDAAYRRHIATGRLLGRRECQDRHARLILDARAAQMTALAESIRIARRDGREQGIRGSVLVGLVAWLGVWWWRGRNA